MSDIFTIHDFENEQQWLKGRMNGIGGSDASVTIGRNPYKSNVELYEEKIGKVVPEDISDKPCVIYGNKAEGPIRELFQAEHPELKVDYHEFRILQSKEHPFMQASLDGELTDQDGHRGILEIKTSSINQSLQYAKWKDQIPRYSISTTSDQDYLKEQMRTAVKKGGWINIVTHANSWASVDYEMMKNKVREIISYAKEIGLEIGTFGQCYNEWKAVLYEDEV